MFKASPLKQTAAGAPRIILGFAGILVLATGFALPSAATAQGAPASAKPLPQFTAVSIKPSAPNEKGYMWQRDPGFWAGRRNTLFPVIDYAYEVSRQEIQGLPAWVNSQFYDFQATMPPDTSVADVRLMMQSMLAERFQFKAHTEMRPEEVSLLTKDGAPGPGLKPASASCVPTANHPKGAFGTVSEARTKWILAGCSVSTAEIAHYFTVFTPINGVLDDTGLKGLYDVNVTVNYPPPFKNEPLPQRRTDVWLGFKKAFAQQLGLGLDRMKTVKRPFPVLVVDHIAPLSGN